MNHIQTVISWLLPGLDKNLAQDIAVQSPGSCMLKRRLSISFMRLRIVVSLMFEQQPNSFQVINLRCRSAATFLVDSALTLKSCSKGSCRTNPQVTALFQRIL